MRREAEERVKRCGSKQKMTVSSSPSRTCNLVVPGKMKTLSKTTTPAFFAEMTMQIVGYRTEKRQETRHLLWARDRRNQIPLAPLSSSNILTNAKRRKDKPRTAEQKSPAPQASSETRSVAREGRPRRRSRNHAQSPRSRGTRDPGKVHAEFLLCPLAFP